MAYALYRNYRPKKFSELIGQDDIVRTLRNQVASGRVGQAYLFTGIRGTGKTTLARILAKAVNCLQIRDGEPCGECEICRGIDNGTILDITEIDAASNNGVDNIRELRDETAYVPNEANYRVYIIDEVHMLSPQAFNALLKTLEEPPEHVKFILATTEIHRVPATILSRCQRFDLKRISIKDISGYLLKVAGQINVELEEEAAVIIAQHADGAMRDALSILDTCVSMEDRVDIGTVRRLFGSSESEYLFRISAAAADGDAGELLKEIDILYMDSLNPASITAELLRHYRNILVTLTGNLSLLDNLAPEYVEQYSKTAVRYTQARVIEILKRLKELAGLLPSAVDKRLQLEICMIELCADPGIKSGRQKETAASMTAEPAVAEPAGKESAGVPEPSADSGNRTKKEPEAIAQRKVSASDRLFEEWPRVKEELASLYPAINAFLSNSVAYISDTHILIDCDDFAKKNIRDNKSYAECIKNAILKTTGINLPIGPYIPAVPEKQTEKKENNLELLSQRAKELGIPVEII